MSTKRRDPSNVVHLSLPKATQDDAAKLADQYGPCASVSAVVRLALAQLADKWVGLEGCPEAAGAERARMLDHLPHARRGPAVKHAAS